MAEETYATLVKFKDLKSLKQEAEATSGIGTYRLPDWKSCK